jgi:hypothetical protein
VTGRRPLVVVALRLHHIHPSSWLRTVLVVVPVVAGVVLWLADLASPWAILAAPVVVALVLKANDVLAGLLRR